MHLIYLGLSLGIIWLNLAGLSLLVRCWVPEQTLARTTGFLGVALIGFFLEHFVGFGNLSWVWPLTSAASVYLIYENHSRFETIGFWRSELVFAGAFAYPFFWRFMLPSINASTERITDLYWISNYMPGATLPPLDNWSPPDKFDYYYAFQHYAAALFGRIFKLDIGTTYNLMFCILMALPVTLAWYIASRAIKPIGLRILLVVSLMLGGTGITPMLHLAFHAPEAPAQKTEQSDKAHCHAVSNHAFKNIVMTARFLGSYDENSYEGRVNKEWAEALFPIDKPSEDFKPRSLPLEGLGYQYFIGNYHPPIGGFLLLLFALALMFMVETNNSVLVGQALMGASIPLVLITNTWVFPLQGFLLCGWIAYRYWRKQPPSWLHIVGGGLAVGILAQPFLAGFVAGGVAMPAKLVTGDDHTPLARYLAMQWPILVLMVLTLLEPNIRKLGITLVATFAGLLIITECIYMDDPSGDQFNRTNTVMKWWGWIYVGALVSLGAICLGSAKKWIRWPAILVLVIINVAVIDVATYFTHTGKTYAGKLRGHDWFTSVKGNKQIFDFLKQAPKGVVLESLPDNAYMHSSVYSIFNDKPVLLGWPSHLRTWHGEVPYVWTLTSQIREFYKGKLDDSLSWLAAHNVDYVVMGSGDGKANFEAIKKKIESKYYWFGFNKRGQRPTGVWVRKSMSDARMKIHP